MKGRNMSLKIEVFTTPPCASCKPALDKTERVVEELKAELRSDIRVEKVDITKKENLARAWKYSITSVPTIVIAGKEKLIGIPKKDEILEIIKKHIH